VANIVVTGADNFAGGLVSSIPAHELNDNMLSACENFQVNRRGKIGMLVKRRGYSDHWDESATYTGIAAIHNFEDSGGTDHLLMLADDGVDMLLLKRSGAASSTTLHTFSGATGKDGHIFTASTDYAIIAVDGEDHKRYDGSTVSSINAPSGATKVISADHRGRVWVLKGKSNLQHSAIDDEDDFTSTDNAGNLRARTSKVTGIVSIGEAGMFITGFATTILMTGDNFFSFGQLELSTEVGCMSFKSMVSFGSMAMWLSKEGVVQATGNGLQIVSGGVDGIIDSMTRAAMKGASGFKHDDEYILCYDSDDDGVNDRAIAYDTRIGAWREIEPTPFIGGTEVTDRSTYVASQDDGKVWKWDNGKTDDGVTISATAETKDFDFGQYMVDKRPMLSYFNFEKQGSGATLTTQLKVDRTDVGSTGTIDLTKEGFADTVFFSDAGEGKLVRLKFTNTSATDVVEVNSFMIMADLSPPGDA